MSSLDLIGPAVRSMTLPQYHVACARDRGQQIEGENGGDICRAATSSVDGVADLFGLVNTSVQGGHRQENDPTAGWVRAVPLPNYLDAKIASIEIAPRMERVGRGESAASVAFSLVAQGWNLAKYGCQFCIDEQDANEGGPLDAYMFAMEETGRASRRAAIALVIATLLNNGTLDSDGIAIFDASRGNYGTGALSEANLDAGLAAMASQTKSDRDSKPVHQNLEPKYLIVPSALLGLARRLARNLSTGSGGDLIVRSESRLGPDGVVNPVDDTVVTGSDTNWLLAASSDAVPSVLLGALHGRVEPRVREFKLDGGQWGYGFDVSQSLACTVRDPDGLYFSTGAA